MLFRSAMLMLVSYDVSTTDAAGKRRLRRIAKACQNYGIRAKYSLFECNVDPAQWVKLKAELEDNDCKYEMGKICHLQCGHSITPEKSQRKVLSKENQSL